MKNVTFAELKPKLDASVPRQKNVFISYAQGVAPQTRVGKKTGKGRLTAGQALVLLGIK